MRSRSIPSPAPLHCLRYASTASSPSLPPLAPRFAASLEESVLRRLAGVSHPLTGELLGRGGGSGGLLRGVRAARLSPGSELAEVLVELSPHSAAATGACAALVRAVEAAGGAAVGGEGHRVRAVLLPRAHSLASMSAAAPALAGVGSAVAVSSCKGGVGKSSVATNLAFALAELGGRPALFDADVYGPSLPTMVSRCGRAGGGEVGEAPAQMRLANARLAPVEVLVGEAGVGGGGGVVSGGGGAVGGAASGAGSIGCASYGWLSPRRRASPGGDAAGLASDGGGAAVMRGPMVSNVVSQLLRGTEWGSRDTLVLDMPPGTGDIGITLGQALPLTAAVLVTTPQRLALVDVLKGADMWASLRVPIAAIVLNCAHLEVRHGGVRTRVYPFGDGGPATRALAAQLGVRHVLALPMDADLSAAGDAGLPALLAHPRSHSAEVFRCLAEIVASECALRAGEGAQREGGAAARARSAGACALLSRRAGLDEVAAGAAAGADAGAAAGAAAGADRGAHGGTSVTLDERTGELLLSRGAAPPQRLPPRALRLACRCAACVDEMSGAQRLQPDMVPASVRPLRIQSAGNYAVAVAWSDGHSSSLYTHAQLEEMVGAGGGA